MNNQKQLSVEQFKQFVKRHPKLVREVRQKKRSWQDIYEEWYLLGEEDETWQQYKGEESATENNTKDSTKKESNSDLMGQVLNMVKNVDMNELQKHITNVSGALSNVQQLMDQFQSPKQSNQRFDPSTSTRHDPFSFRKD